MKLIQSRRSEANLCRNVRWSERLAGSPFLQTQNIRIPAEENVLGSFSACPFRSHNSSRSEYVNDTNRRLNILMKEKRILLDQLKRAEALVQLQS